MALVHNALIRALNSIYLQAPNVKDPVDVADFVTYMNSWPLFLHKHHATEESVAFPFLETAINMPGFMEKNIEQHHAFGPGMAEYDEYVKACQAGKETFDAERVRKIIDGFAAALIEHLTEEIATLLSLEEYGEMIDWKECTKRTQEDAVAGGDPVRLPFTRDFTSPVFSIDFVICNRSSNSRASLRTCICILKAVFTMHSGHPCHGM